ncbi:MAG: serpin family protein, partial [Planctomycetaceae bacterium]
QVASLKTQQVRVGLPRFRLETQYSLKGTLSEMGMPTAFGRSADLTGLTDASEGRQLSISQVEHKAFLEVNEQGSEAAAATAVVVTARSARPRAAAFIANRPFLFAIRDRASGLLLFLGRLSQPQK